MIPEQSQAAGLKHVPRAEFGLLFTTSLHAATYISTVTGQKYHALRGPARTPAGALQVRWAFESTPLADEAYAIWNSVGLPAFGTPKDWDKMSLDERKAVVNVLTAFSANLHFFLKDVHAQPFLPYLPSIP